MEHGIKEFLLHDDLQAKINAKLIDPAEEYTALGDSITEGTGATDGLGSYADRINEQVGFTVYTNLGAGGATVKPTVGRADFNDQVDNIPLTSSLITVLIGVNDWSLGNSLGDVQAVLAKSYATLDRTLSFAEAFRYNMETIKINFPNAKIYVITPINATEQNDYFEEYVEVEIAIANYLSIPVINARDGSGIYSGSPYFADIVHPNNAGHIVLKNYVLSKLNSNGDATASKTLNDVMSISGATRFPVIIIKQDSGITTPLTLVNKQIPGADNGVQILFEGYTPLTKLIAKSTPTLGPNAMFGIQNNAQSNLFNIGFWFTGSSNAFLINTIIDDGIHKLQVNGGAKVDFMSWKGMTTTEINAIESPVDGMEVYNTTLGVKCQYSVVHGGWIKYSYSNM